MKLLEEEEERNKKNYTKRRKNEQKLKKISSHRITMEAIVLRYNIFKKKQISAPIVLRWKTSYDAEKQTHHTTIECIIVRCSTRFNPRNSINRVIHHHNSHHLRKELPSEVERSRITQGKQLSTIGKSFSIVFLRL
jgi:hypothetical protein